MSFETQVVERKVLSILKVLSNSQEPLGATVIARRLRGHGFVLGERAVRYHLRMMDERGLTKFVGRRQGRLLTDQGIEEIKSAMVQDKVGFAISRIETLAFRTTFDLEKRCGLLPVNVSFFQKRKFGQALKAMQPAFEAHLCASDLVASASEGKRLGELLVPEGMIGLATVCSIAINGSLLKAGVPMDSRFGGLLQIRNHQPFRFAELIHYASCSLDPTEIFIMAKMTQIGEVVKRGEGNILANFREIPMICRPIAQQVMTKLKEAGIGGVLIMGETSEPVCEITVEPNKMGIVLIGGLNPVAAAQEAGIEAENRAMSTVMEYKDLIKFQELGERY